jgi:ADP-ribosyl-[dinitrogen reductase] hydrolase
MFHPALKEQLYAACWGFIVGDALGVPYEFNSREQMTEHPATGMIGYGTYNQPPGTWSDDSSMMLCVLENLAKDGSARDLADLFLRWYRDGYHTAGGQVFDIGLTTLDALTRLSEGVHPTKAGNLDERSAGNGSLMRCVPYAFAAEISESIFNMILQNRITHPLTICHEACMFYVKMLRALAEGSTKEQALTTAGAYLRYGWRIVDQDDNTNFDKFSRLFNPSFSSIPVDKIQSSGYVMHTLESCIWCFMNSNNYSQAVLKAVNLGGDTDTIAALTGALAATSYGSAQIPVEWSTRIQRGQELEAFIKDCIA